MKAKEYDFSNAKRGSVVAPQSGKTRITIRIDDELLNWFRQKVHEAGGGDFEMLINEALRQYVHRQGVEFEKTLRKVIREELKTMAKRAA